MLFLVLGPSEVGWERCPRDRGSGGGAPGGWSFSIPLSVSLLPWEVEGGARSCWGWQMTDHPRFGRQEPSV